MNTRKTIRQIIVWSAVALLYGGACILKSHFTKEVLWKGGKLLSTGSIKESNKRGCFVEQLFLHPEVVEVSGTSIRFGEVWLEKEHDLSFVAVLIPGLIEYPVFTVRSGYNINFTLADSNIPDDLMRWMFVMEGQGHSFSVNSTKVGPNSIGYLSDSIESNNWHSISVFLSTNWQFENAMTFTISKAQPAGRAGNPSTLP
jgi:hypothetical protein